MQRKNSYSLSKNTLTLIENEIDMDELMIDFNDYDIDLNIDIKKNRSSNYPNEKINNLSHYFTFLQMKAEYPLYITKGE